MAKANPVDQGTALEQRTLWRRHTVAIMARAAILASNHLLGSQGARLKGLR
jgi:hypothetical protein